MSACRSKPSSGADEPLHDLRQALFRVVRQLVFREAPHSVLADLPLSQIRCLHVIHRHEGEKMQELADRMEVKLPAMSQIVERLVKRGMVERHADPSDRRVVRLGLTEEARTILADARASREARLTASAKNLDAESLAKVVEGLRLLGEAAERADVQGKAESTITMDSDPLVEMMAQRARRGRAEAEVVAGDEKSGT